MTTYYVSSGFRYVIIDAEDEAAARIVGLEALHDDLQKHIGRDAPISIHTIRPATDDEIEMNDWHNEIVAQNAEWIARQNAK